MPLVLVIAIAVGLARGGKISNLAEIGVRAWWLLIVGFALLVTAGFLPRSMHDLAVGLVLASYVLLLIFILMHRQMAGLWVAGLGILMNFTVIAVNGGMPVMLEAVEVAFGSADMTLGAKHVLLTEETHLAFLADVIPLPYGVISLGDVFLAIGLGVFVEDQIRRPVRLFAAEPKAPPDPPPRDNRVPASPPPPLRGAERSEAGGGGLPFRREAGGEARPTVPSVGEGAA